MIKIVMYSKNGCSFCDMARMWFNNHNYEINEIKIDDFEERKKFYESCGDGVKTMPQIFINDERVGGYQDFIDSNFVKEASVSNFDNDF